MKISQNYNATYPEATNSMLSNNAMSVAHLNKAQSYAAQPSANYAMQGRLHDSSQYVNKAIRFRYREFIINCCLFLVHYKYIYYFFKFIFITNLNLYLGHLF